MKTMNMRKQNTQPGFSLLELMVAMTIGLIVLGAATSLFRTGMNATFLVAQRAETQQNMRAAIDMINKDIGLAGAGITGGVQLPLGGGGGASRYGCDQGGTCYVVTHAYNANYLYGIVPGFSNGVQGGAVVPSAPAPAINDSITVVYCDYNFPLFNYNVTAITAPGDQITVAPNPLVVPAPVAINSPGGIQVGDLILLSNNLGSAVGEVTGLTATTISFANLDPLNINQSGATTNNIKAIAGGANTSVYRLFAVTYYLTVPAVAGQLPRLMRQVNGLTPVPVADNIINLQFAYDVYNTTTSALDSNQANPIGAGESPNLIQKVNIVVMGQSMTPTGDRAQSMYLATSVSARDMAFKNRYK
jgi:prepilin-type N-terminal cleavage/methylation domain-containing protein